MTEVKVNWSGGKDSTAALLLHIKAGHKVKAVNYIPMFTDEIPLLIKCHYDFIKRSSAHFRALGVPVYTVSGITYCDEVRRRSTKGKYKGRAFGFPLFYVGMCGFKRDSKQKELDGADVGYFDYEDIGIAADEKKRCEQLNERKRSILVELGVRESDAVDICKSAGLLSPLYDRFKRDGCALCPNAPKAVREQWFKDYPEAIPIVKELQEFVKRERPEQTPLRNCQWFL